MWLSRTPSALWRGLIDDAAIFPPGDAALPDAVTAWQDRQSQWYRDLVGSFVVRDTDLGSALAGIPVSVVCTAGAGAVDSVASLAARQGLTLAGLEIALRDVDDLAGNARRVEYAVRAAQDDGRLPLDVPVYLELPQGEITHGWQAAADVAEESGQLRLKFRTGGIDAHLFPTAAQLAAWIEAADQRDLAWKCTAGLHRAVRHRDPATGFEHHGFLNILAAAGQARAAADSESVLSALELTTIDDLRQLLTPDVVERVRTERFVSFGSCEVVEPVDDLVAFNLVGAPA